jgi:hypothetical protein
MRAELIRDLYSRRPETVFSQPWELQMLLWSLGYTDELVDERDGPLWRQPERTGSTTGRLKPPPT